MRFYILFLILNLTPMALSFEHTELNKQRQLYYSFYQFKIIIKANLDDILKIKGETAVIKYRLWLAEIKKNKRKKLSFDPNRLPLSPSYIYSHIDGFVNWVDLGFPKRYKGSNFYPFREFKDYIKEHRDEIMKFEGEAIGVKYRAWLNWLRNNKKTEVSFDPKRMHGSPGKYYKDKGWVSFYDLGFPKTNSQSKFYPYEQFEKIIKENIGQILKAKGRGSSQRYQMWLKSLKNKTKLSFDPKKLTATPDIYYKDQSWPGWRELGFVSERKGSEFYSFKEFEDIIKKHKEAILSFKGRNFNIKYQAWLKHIRHIGNRKDLTFNPMRLRSDASIFYKDEGFSWRTLGFLTEKKGEDFYSLERFKQIIKDNMDDILKFTKPGITQKYEAWLRWVREHKNREELPFNPMSLPVNPNKYYRDKKQVFSWRDLKSKGKNPSQRTSPAQNAKKATRR